MKSLKLYGSVFLCALAMLGIAYFFNVRAYNRATAQNQTEGVPELPTHANLIDFSLLGQTTPDENYEPVYPESLRAYDGKEVVVRGFMTPFDQLEDMKTFMILGFPTGCSFCAPPAANQVILARQPDRKNAYEFIEGPIEVRGKLSLWKPESGDPAHTQDSFLYVIEHVKVQALPEQSLPKPAQHRQ